MAGGSSSSGSSSHHKLRSADAIAASLSASEDAARAERKQRKLAAKEQAAAEAAAEEARAEAALEAESEEQAAAAADSQAAADEADDNDSQDDAADEEQADNSDAEHSSASANSAREHSSDDDIADITTPAGMQAALMSLLKQRKADKAAAKASRAQIQQLQAQLHTQATSAVRFGVVRNTGASLAPASRSTLKTEPGVAARQQTAASAAAPSLQQRQRALQAAERARMPDAPGIQAAMRAAPPRLALPEVKPELEAKALSADPTLLRSWVFQMERLLTALEDASEQPYTFGDRLKLARRHWDQGMDAWWSTLCEARASARDPPVCSWAGLLTALRDTFAPVSDGLAVGREIQQLKQGSSESMEAYVRRVLELQGRVSSADWPSHVVAMLALNGVDESRYPWTTTHVRNALVEFANTRGHSADMAYLAHQLRTQAPSEPKIMRGAGSGSVELVSLKAELAKLQRQITQGSQVAHTAAVRTSGANLSESSSSSTHGSGGGSGQGRTKRSGKPTGKRMSSAERQRCYDNELCFFCKKSGHVSRECPERAAAKAKKEQQQKAEEHGAEGAPSSGN